MTGPLAGLDYAMLLVFSAGTVVVVIATVMVSAFLPRHSGPVAGHGGLGGTLVWLTVGATLLLFGVLVNTASFLPLSVAIVVAGLAVLGAPFLAEPIPRNLRESRLALLVLLVLIMGCLLALPAFWSN